MDMRWLDDVLILLEERNMTRAAERRNITQPAFSRRIRSFEHWLGVTILDRKTNSIGLSPALIDNEDEIRGLVSRLTELKFKIAHHNPAAAVVAIAAQHTAVFSTFPDMALRAMAAFPGVRFRMRAGNLGDCVAMFVRGDTSMLLCYEATRVDTLQFGPDVQRGTWGHDYLVPVVGGTLRYSVKDNRNIAADTASIVYPENSYFGQVLKENNKPFGTADLSANPFCQTAFSSGIKEMVLSGLGVGWLPYSMIHKEVESGEVISLASQFGQVHLTVAIYAHEKTPMATKLLALWATSG
jgi:DNA-binding transcriptional LysR family regulator